MVVAISTYSAKGRVFRDKRRQRGLSLVEVLITLAIMTLVTGTAVMGLGQLRKARLRQSAVMIASAMRVAYSHASAIGKPVRLVFDFEQRMVSLEEGARKLAIDRKSKTGGAEASTDAEREKDLEEAKSDRIGEQGLRPAKPAFQPTKAFGFDGGKDKPGKVLADGIRFVQVDTLGREGGAIEDGRAYLYFFPGGQTERAIIQIVLGNPAEADVDSDFMSILISPLTGKPTIRKGRVELKRPNDDDEESEREDSGF